MLASWVQQAGFDPPMLTVAVRRDRYVADWVAGSGRFTLNQLAAGSKRLIRHFGRGFEPDAPAFEGVALRDDAAPSGPVLAGALAYLDAEVAGELDGGDHRDLPRPDRRRRLAPPRRRADGPRPQERVPLLMMCMPTSRATRTVRKIWPTIASR